MNLCNKRLVVEVILEIIMLMAPTYLDTLGAAGEFILKLNQPTMEFTCGTASNAEPYFKNVEQMSGTISHARV